MCGGQILSSPDKSRDRSRQSRGKRNEVSERVPSAGGEIGLALGQVSRGANPPEPRQVGIGPDKVGVNATK